MAQMREDNKHKEQKGTRGAGGSQLTAYKHRLWEYCTAAPVEIFRNPSPRKEKIQQFLLENLNDRQKRQGIWELKVGR